SGSTTPRRLSSTIAAITSAWKTNAARQLIPVVIRPPISGPAAAPMPAAAMIVPKALARDVTSLKARVVRMETGGISSADPTPSKTELPRISTPRPGEAALSRAPIPYSVRPQVKHRLRPQRSVSLLQGIIRMAMISRNRVIVVCTAFTVVSSHRGFQVVADVRDHHVHVRPGEAADELRQRERKDQPPGTGEGTTCRRGLATGCALSHIWCSRRSGCSGLVLLGLRRAVGDLEPLSLRADEDVLGSAGCSDRRLATRVRRAGAGGSESPPRATAPSTCRFERS